MYRIESKVQTGSAAFKENDAFQREALALAISLFLNAPIADHRFGVFRM